MLIYNFDNNRFDFYSLIKTLIYENTLLDNIQMFQSKSYFNKLWQEDLELSKICNKFLKEEVYPKLNDNYYLSEKPRLDVCFPQTNSDIITSNKDVLSIIVPVTEMYHTNSIYYDTKDGFINLKLNRNEFAICNFFDLEEYTCKNNTNITRFYIQMYLKLI